MTKRILVKSITFKWSESNLIVDNSTVSTFVEANKFISDVAFDMRVHDEQGYTKTAFIITWIDGREHEGRIDIQQSTYNKTNPLGEHVRYFYEGLAGLRCPSSWSQEEYLGHLKSVYKIDAEGMEEIRGILETYALEDILQPTEEIISPISEHIETAEKPNIDNFSITAHVTYNSALNGIEIAFTDKPDQTVIENLKSNGFRWSKRGFWYAKQSTKTKAFADTLKDVQSAHNSDEISEQPISYPDIDIDDLHLYTVSDELQRSVNMQSMFERDWKNDCSITFQGFQTAAIEVLAITDDEYMIYNIKKYLQSFKKRYYDMYIKMLNHRKSNPSWAVTGRGNLNVNRYNKASNRYDNIIGSLAELSNEFDKRMKQIKNQIIEKHRRQEKAEIESALAITELKDVFKVGKINIDTYSKPLRSYTYKAYTIVKNWGMFRIYKNGKEVKTTLKTTDTLETAKRYVLMIDTKKTAEELFKY